MSTAETEGRQLRTQVCLLLAEPLTLNIGVVQHSLDMLLQAYNSVASGCGLASGPEPRPAPFLHPLC
jgi:hypothetical protein